MSSTNNETIFKTKVLPIMEQVMKNLRRKQAEEIGRHTRSLPYILAGAAGPDDGMSAQAASLDALRYTGEWNSKHTEDYIQMVKDELKKQGIVVTPEIEKMMIDKMIQDKIPKSSIEYIMRKAATNTIFYLPQAMSKSPLEDHITEEAEKRYNPSTLEKGTGFALGAAADYLTMGGFGGGWKSAASFIGTDLLINGVASKVGEPPTVAPDSGNTVTPATAHPNGRDERYKDVPLIVAPGQEEAWLAEQARLKAEREAQEQVETAQEAPPVLPTGQNQTIEMQPVTEQPEQTNTSGWNGLLSTFGLNGIGDIGHNLGYVLAMLPDLLVGMFTGKTKLNIKDNLLPIASIAAGMFVKNPVLKMILIAMGGLNLLNKAGHEALDKQHEQGMGQGGNQTRSHYRVYQDEPLNPRISNPQLRGNCLIAVIDRVPYTIALPDTVVDAYRQGALPLNTLANAVVAKNDQMQQMASRNRRSSESKDENSRSLPSRDGGRAELNYEAGEQQTVTRTLAQR